MSSVSPLRNLSKKKLIEALDQSQFTRYNFTVAFDGFDDEAIAALIKFDPFPNAYFCVRCSAGDD
jgi:hypothetical protein